jgi:hypothetical protein
MPQVDQNFQVRVSRAKTPTSRPSDGVCVLIRAEDRKSAKLTFGSVAAAARYVVDADDRLDLSICLRCAAGWVSTQFLRVRSWDREA